jgi:meiotically up-regulated gene 157 (Mug157) protein
VEELENKLPEKSEIKEMFNRCFINTINTTVEPSENDISFVLTGDIPAMWLRDSAAQVSHYLPFAKEYREIDLFIEGVIKRQFMYIAIDPYANSFNREPNRKGHKADITEQNDWVWERKYEIDSLCYPVQLI